MVRVKGMERGPWARRGLQLLLSSGVRNLTAGTELP